MAREARQTERSGGAGRKRGVGKMNARPALAFAAAEFRANEVGAPPRNLSQMSGLPFFSNRLRYCHPNLAYLLQPNKEFSLS